MAQMAFPDLVSVPCNTPLDGLAYKIAIDILKMRSELAASVLFTSALGYGADL